MTTLEATSSVLAAAFREFLDPPRSCRPVGFWFVNDALTPAEVREQVAAYAAAGYGGLVLHPRVGLPRSLGYLTPAWFALVRAAAEACRDHGLQVLLYDEASYPSGSANGAVVAEDPSYAARGLGRVHEDVAGPRRGFWRPSIGRSLAARLLSVAAVRRVGDWVDSASLQCLEVDELGVAAYDLGPGSWRLMACFDRPSGGTIRGAFGDQDDDSALAPPAGNVLDPAAVACFLRLTHDAYAEHLGDLFGSVVTAVFTDEPSPLGRNHHPGLFPYTPGLEDDFAVHLGQTRERALLLLPLLWEVGDLPAQVAAGYEACVHARVRDVLFGSMARWCADHGLALTGHPDLSNDMGCLEPFDWPGQDVVWRWVLPGTTSLEGVHSTSALVASSAALLWGRRHSITEVFGAYGWQLTLDEMKFLLDWHLARGTNLVVTHALFASLRGGRAWESEPDLGPQHPAFEHVCSLVAYAGRLSSLLTEVVREPSVAVVGEGHALPWEVATWLLQHQLPAAYVPAEELGRGVITAGGFRVGQHTYRAVVIDCSLGEVRVAEPVLAALRRAGLPVVVYQGERSALAVLDDARAEVHCDDRAALRVVRTTRGQVHHHLLFNEGEQDLAIEVTLPDRSVAQWWDPLRGSQETAMADGTGRLGCVLPRRESRVLAWVEADVAAVRPEPPSERVLEDPVSLTEWMSKAPVLRDWAMEPGWERFAGTVSFRTTAHLTRPVLSVELDLGEVGESAVVLVNGQRAGSAMWSPYRVTVPGHLWREGENDLQVLVTNSPANRYDGAQRRSGLLGPVTMLCKRLQSR